MATIATHNGSQVAREHNRRNEKVVSKEEHIRRDGSHENWVDEDPRKAYERIFGEAVKEYNEKQTREDRKITNYYNSVEKDAKKHTVYEMIIGVYGKDENGAYIDENIQKSILKDFVNEWKERNPNLEMIGAYYHNDEENPHCHIDYIPVARGYTKGMSVQNGLVKALEGQGIVKEGRATAQIKWEHRENEALEEICGRYGISVEHPREENKKHLDTKAYKEEQRLEGLIDNCREMLDTQGEIEKEINSINEQKEALKGEIERLEGIRDKANDVTMKALKTKEKALSKSYQKEEEVGYTYNRAIEKDIKNIHEELKEEINQVKHTSTEASMEYAKANELKRRALEDRQQASEELKVAKEMKMKLGEYIIKKAQEMLTSVVEKVINKYFHQLGDKEKRMSTYMSKIKLPDGTTALDGFNREEAKHIEILKNRYLKADNIHLDIDKTNFDLDEI